MYHDKKTALKHQDILIRRGFNIPVADAVLKVKEEIKGERLKAKGEISDQSETVQSPAKSVKSNKSKSVKLSEATSLNSAENNQHVKKSKQ